MSESYPLPLTRGEESGKKPVRLVRAAVRIAVIIQHARERQCLFVLHPIKGFELPGGAIEAGEIPHQAALRELGEESGVQLPLHHPLKLVTFLPVVDQRGGNWLDTLYTTVVIPEQLTIQRGAEFPAHWLRAQEIESLVDRELSSYQAALLALDANP